MSCAPQAHVPLEKARRREDVLPIMTLHLLASPAAQKWQNESAGIRNVGSHVNERVTAPHRTERSTELVALAQERTGHDGRHEHLHERSAENTHETPEDRKKRMTGLMKHEMHAVRG